MNPWLSRISAALLASLSLGFCGSSANAMTITVYGNSDIFSAGLASEPAPGAQLPPSISVYGAEILQISATGLVGYFGGYSGTGPSGIGGTSSIYNTTGSTVGSYNGPVFALAGVFLGGASSTPFTIGDGGTFVVPTGATALYLGLPDAPYFNGPSGNYYDNSGSLQVNVSPVGGVPEPATWTMMLLGVGGVGVMMRARRHEAKGAVAAG